ncbi:MAG TPA: glycosyltransferase family 2 protein [Thermoanaerobaculia bacterium]|nr:glycosyltransferase family 2 protein [Thermoanaerobaculia bacterium]
MKLSVIIPTYDTADMTLVCCASVMAALPADAEVIVVDDGSTDGTATRVRDMFPSIIVLRQPLNRGFAAAVNAGVAESRGEIVLLLNSDTRVFALAPFIDAFARDARLGVAGAQLVNAEGALQWSAGKAPTALWMVVMVSGVMERRRPRRLSGERPAPVPDDGGETPPAQPARRRRSIDWVSGAAMAIRRSVWDAIGPMREDFRFYAQDLDFCIRAKRAGWNVRLLDDVRVEHRHGATIARDREQPYAPELLWLDLLTWGRDEYGGKWARRTRRAMITVAFVRSLFSRDRRGYDALRHSRL